MAKSLTLLETEMSEADVHHFAGMQVVVYSNKAPDKQGVNEDAVGIFTTGTNEAVIAVADGAGGQRAGAQASATVINCLRDTLQGRQGDIRGAILDAIDSANAQICAQGNGSATTLAVLELFNGSVRPYHAGDAVILITGQRGRLRLHTVSHSPVGYAVESGMLDEHEAMHHDERHFVSNMLGMPDLSVEMGTEIALAPHDTVVIASDGLFDNMHINELIETVRRGSLVKAADKLITLVNARMQGTQTEQPSKPDDLSFVLIRRR